MVKNNGLYGFEYVCGCWRVKDKKMIEFSLKGWYSLGDMLFCSTCKEGSKILNDFFLNKILWIFMLIIVMS